MVFVSLGARIIGGLILIIWPLSLYSVRRMCRLQQHWMWSTIFQYAILPFIVGMSLLIFGNPLLLILGIVAWMLSIFFPKFFMFVFPLAAGWGLGRGFFSYLEPLPAFWKYAAGPIGLVTMFIICSILTSVVTNPHSKLSNKEINMRIINKLDELLKKIFAVLTDLYKDRFANDSREKAFRRAGTLLNELVVENLRGKQVEFKANNSDFVNEEKSRLLEIEEVRKGILSFLIAKGALYRSWGHEDAEIWLNKAKELEPSIEIPNTLEEILKVIEDSLFFYETRLIDKKIEQAKSDLAFRT